MMSRLYTDTRGFLWLFLQDVTSYHLDTSRRLFLWYPWTIKQASCFDSLCWFKLYAWYGFGEICLSTSWIRSQWTDLPRNSLHSTLPLTAAHSMLTEIVLNKLLAFRNILWCLSVPVDNKICIQLPHDEPCKRPNLTSFHYVWEVIAKGFVVFTRIPGAENPTDILSKHWSYSNTWPLCSLGKEKLWMLMSLSVLIKSNLRVHMFVFAHTKIAWCTSHGIWSVGEWQNMNKFELVLSLPPSRHCSCV